MTVELPEMVWPVFQQILVFIMMGRCELKAMPIYLFKGFLKFFPAKRAWSPSSSSILKKQKQKNKKKKLFL